MARGRKPKSKRPMRYPNGYGTVYQLSQPERRRHPWVVKKPKERKNFKKKWVDCNERWREKSYFRI